VDLPEFALNHSLLLQEVLVTLEEATAPLAFIALESTLLLESALQLSLPSAASTTAVVLLKEPMSDVSANQAETLSAVLLVKLFLALA